MRALFARYRSLGWNAALLICLWFSTTLSGLGAATTGSLNFDNFVPGSLSALIYGVSSDDPSRIICGNPANGIPAGSADYGNASPLSGAAYAAELWAGPDAGSLTVVAASRVSLGTGARAGRLGASAGISSLSIPGSLAGNSIYYQLRVWATRGGTVSSWAKVLVDPTIQRGSSMILKSAPLGGLNASDALVPTPILSGLRGLGLHTGDGDCEGPVIQLQPAAQAVLLGTRATFSVIAGGTPPFVFTWMKDGLIASNGVISNTVASSTFSLSNSASADAGFYSVEVKSELGTGLSDTAKLTLNTPPTLSLVGGVTLTERSLSANVFVTVGDLETPAASLSLAARSSDTNLLPAANITVSGSGSNRTVTVRKVAGRFGNAFVTVVVADREGAVAERQFPVTAPRCPILLCPTNIVAECFGPSGTQVRYDVMASTDCPGATLVNCSPASGSLFPMGDTLVRCVAADSFGQTTNCSFTVTVRDTQAPTLFCPADRSVVATSTQGSRVSYDVRVFDSCDPQAGLICTPASGDLFPIGVTTVLCVAQDRSGNVSRCSFSVTVRASVCAPSSSGTEFWLGFPGNFSDSGAVPQAALNIVGRPGTSGLVEMLSPNLSLPFTIPDNARSVTVLLPASTDSGLISDGVQTNGVHITASEPVSIVGMNHADASSEGFLALPVEALGREYIVLGYGNTHEGVEFLNGSEFSIAASEDNTTVTFVLPADGSNGPKAARTVVLSRWQTYHLRQAQGKPGDLSGTVITSDRPVAVFGGHRCAAVPDSSVWTCNHLVEQLPPTSAWGARFYTQPFQTRLGGDRLRVLAARAGTQVTVTPLGGLPVLYALDRGQFFEAAMTRPSVIAASQAVLVAQYANSSDYDGVEMSDALMMLVPPSQTFASAYTVWSPTNGFTRNFLSLIATNAQGPPVVTVDSKTFVLDSVSSPGFFARVIEVQPGVHDISAAVPLGVGVYGFGGFDAYGYPGGFAFPERAAPSLICPEAVTITSTASIPVTVPDFIPRTQITDNCTPFASLSISQDPPAGAAVGLGPHSIRIRAMDASGNASECTVTLTVVDGSPSFAVQPVDVSALEGDTFTLSALALGEAPLSFDWRRAGAPLGAGDRVIGAGTPELKVSSAALTDSGSYTLVVSNRFGDATSRVAQVIIRPGAATPASLSILQGSSGNWELRLTGAATIRYLIESTDSLSLPSWRPVITVVASNAPIVLSIPMGSRTGFFRARVVPPPPSPTASSDSAPLKPPGRDDRRASTVPEKLRFKPSGASLGRSRRRGFAGGALRALHQNERSSAGWDDPEDRVSGALPATVAATTQRKTGTSQPMNLKLERV
ncbi:MAG: HYR domain-containing protein [Verrucomicrobia bacterium]|nr:HYR domain-containing protein [Verrucomicrobiota bacterium]